jgi:ABC-2 type transport system permease protein
VKTGTLPVPELEVRTSEPTHLHVIPRVRQILASREVLSNLVRKEVKVKYTSSILGAAWSTLNPILYLVVFSLVFGVVLRNNTPHFPVYLLSGLLGWTFFSSSLSMSVRSVVDNSNLVTKVYFPREYLPLASVGTALVDLVLQAIVLVAFMLITWTGHVGINLLFLPLSLFALLAVTCALAMLVAALNVQYRDVQHLLNIGLLMWFWFTPVVYPSGLVYERLIHHKLFGVSLLNVYLINPMVSVVLGFQRAFYGSVYGTHTLKNGTVQRVLVLMPVSAGWLAILLGAVSAGSLLLVWLSWRAYFRMSADFAEML